MSSPISDASTPEQLLDALSGVISVHSRAFSIQCSCSARTHPKIFCIVHVQEGGCGAVVKELGGEIRGAHTVVTFIEPPARFACPRRLDAPPAQDCYACYRKINPA